MPAELPLTGGNASAGVVRLGDTVRKPWLPGTPAVHELLRVLATADPALRLPVPGEPPRDATGRQVLAFLPGELAMLRPPMTTPELHGVGALIRRIHDASPTPDQWMSAGRPDFDPPLLPAHDRHGAPAAPDLIGHHDLAPWNLVVDEGADPAHPRFAFIDWNGAGPTTRAWELAYALPAFAVAAPDSEPAVLAPRMRALLDGYDAAPELRGIAVDLLAPRAAAMHALLRDAHRDGVEPWGSMFASGHGAHWRGVADLLAAHPDEWMRALV
ncbi:phosphotransferase [Schumannella sp. 10F1B-5-1]|nr:phosphotransferase [Schumannella sp. 10F1B-5-1]